MLGPCILALLQATAGLTRVGTLATPRTHGPGGKGPKSVFGTERPHQTDAKAGQDLGYRAHGDVGAGSGSQHGRPGSRLT